jgi:hypothetical protein
MALLISANMLFACANFTRAVKREAEEDWGR